MVIMTMLDGAHVLVFGASGGLGSAAGRELAAQGAELTLSGPSTERLETLAAEIGPRVVGTAPGDLLAADVPRAVATRAHEAQGG